MLIKVKLVTLEGLYVRCRYQRLVGGSYTKHDMESTVDALQQIGLAIRIVESKKLIEHHL